MSLNWIRFLKTGLIINPNDFSFESNKDFELLTEKLNKWLSFNSIYAENSR